MVINASARRIVTWMSFFAILLAALAPSISGALSVQQPARLALMEICTPRGLEKRWMPDASSDSSHRPSSSALHAGHCPFCMPQPAFIPPTLPGLLLPQTLFSPPFQLPDAASGTASRPWPRPQPRAPPALV